MADDIDAFLGRRLRRRRRLMGLTQQQLGDSVGIRFQQIQKYECGANRISAARLWALAEALEVPVGYFYEGLSEVGERRPAGEREAEVGGRKDSPNLLRARSKLDERPARRLLDLARSLRAEGSPPSNS